MQDVMERYGLIIGGEKMSTAEYLEIRDPGTASSSASARLPPGMISTGP